MRERQKKFTSEERLVLLYKPPSRCKRPEKLAQPKKGWALWHVLGWGSVYRPLFWCQPLAPPEAGRAVEAGGEGHQCPPDPRQVHVRCEKR